MMRLVNRSIWKHCNSNSYCRNEHKIGGYRYGFLQVNDGTHSYSIVEVGPRIRQEIPVDAIPAVAGAFAMGGCL